MQKLYQHWNYYVNCSKLYFRPIHDACEKGFIHILRLLLSYGADHTIATYSGYLPSNCYDEKIRTFLKGM